MVPMSSLPDALERSDMTVAGRSGAVLREMVLDGRLAPGQRLNEVELAAALGISRGPLREAIQRLASEGLLTTISHRGAYVRKIDATELRELYEFRIAVETHAVRLAATRVSRADVDGLRSMLDRTREILDQGDDVAYPRDLDFHLSLVELAGNSRLFNASVEINQQVQLARIASGKRPARARNAYAEHRSVLTGLAAGDGEKAAAALTQHLRASMASALRLYGSGE